MSMHKENDELEDKKPLASDSEPQNTRKEHLLTRSYWVTWPGAASISFVIAFIAFASNVGILVWALRSPRRNGFAVIYTGDLHTTKQIELASKLIVNVIAIAVFTSSNRCVQYLCAPTRQDLNKCHKKGRWLDIGIRSFRNFKQLQGWRLWLCSVLILTSLPIHYLYNSTIVLSLTGHDYIALTVNSAFTEGAKWNSSAIRPAIDPTRQTDFSDLALNLQSQARSESLTSLEPHDCAKAFATTYQSNWQNLLVVSEDEHLGNSSAGMVANFQSCYVPSVGVQMSRWWSSPYDSGIVPSLSEDVYAFGLDCILEANRTCKPAGNSHSKVKVTQCLAEKAPEDNSVCVSIGFLASVLFATAVKASCLFWARRRKDFVPLLTIGDAISSFLTDPDPCTAGRGPLSLDDVKQGVISMTAKPWPYRAPKKPYRWFKAPAPFLWWLTMFSLLIPLAIPGVALYWNGVATGKEYEDNDSLVITPGGDLNFDNPAIITMNNSFVEVALAANLAQLLLSYIYYLVNDLLTSMVLVNEYHLYSAKRRTLRVTSPHGNQRSTYWLNLPFKLAIPMIIVWSVFHWIASVEMSVVKVDIYDYQGQYDSQKSFTGLALKATGMLIIGCIDIFLIIALLVLGCLKLRPGIPFARTCSLAISAACHRRPDEFEDVIQRPVKYGVLRNTYMGECHCVGFSSESVQPLVSGSIYTSYREVPDDWAWGKERVSDDNARGAKHNDNDMVQETEAEQGLLRTYDSSSPGPGSAG